MLANSIPFLKADSDPTLLSFISVITHSLSSDVICLWLLTVFGHLSHFDSPDSPTLMITGCLINAFIQDSLLTLSIAQQVGHVSIIAIIGSILDHGARVSTRIYGIAPYHICIIHHVLCF